MPTGPTHAGAQCATIPGLRDPRALAAAITAAS
jgi:hypothetical protein